MGILKETRNIFGIASSTVLLTGLILLAIAVLVRTLIEAYSRQGMVESVC
jgi:hypothetical protein